MAKIRRPSRNALSLLSVPAMRVVAVGFRQPEPSCHRFAGQLGLDLEPRQTQPHHGAVRWAKARSAVEATAPQEFEVARSDQQPEGHRENQVACPIHG